MISNGLVGGCLFVGFAGCIRVSDFFLRGFDRFFSHFLNANGDSWEACFWTKDSQATAALWNSLRDKVREKHQVIQFTRNILGQADDFEPSTCKQKSRFLQLIQANDFLSLPIQAFSCWLHRSTASVFCKKSRSTVS